MKGVGFVDWGLRFGVWGLGVWGLGFDAQGSGSWVEDFGFKL